METFEKVLAGVFVLAIVAVALGSGNTSGAISNIGAALATLATNIVGK